MSAQTQPKRQHTVPRIHLKHFAGSDPKGHVWTYDSESGKVWSATPGNTSVEGHFYSVEQLDGTMDTRIEEHLARVETSAAPTYERLLASEIPKTSKDRSPFASFLALMYVRTTATRRLSGELFGCLLQTLLHLRASNDKAFEADVNEMEAKSGKTYDAEDRANMRKYALDPSSLVLQVPKEETLMALGAADELAEILYRMKWALARPLHGYYITSDNPVVRLVDPRTVHRGDGGFKNKTAQVSCPLSPSLTLLLTWESNMPDIGQWRRSAVDHINEAVAAHADRYIFAHINDKRIQRLATKFRFKGSRVRLRWTRAR